MKLIVLVATMQIVIMNAPIKMTTAPVQQFNGKFTPLLAPAGYCGQINLTIGGSYNTVDPRPGCAQPNSWINVTDNSGNNTLVAGVGMGIKLVNGSSMWQNERYDLRSLPGDVRTTGTSNQTDIQFQGPMGWQTAITLVGVPVAQAPLSVIRALH